MEQSLSKYSVHRVVVLVIPAEKVVAGNGNGFQAVLADKTPKIKVRSVDLLFEVEVKGSKRRCLLENKKDVLVET